MMNRVSGLFIYMSSLKIFILRAKNAKVLCNMIPVALGEQSERWNKVYSKSGTLPWTKVPFSEGVKKYLSSLNKDEPLLVSGCGTGETVNTLNEQGFDKVTGTDISEEAINRAKKSFPQLTFRVVATEDLKNEEQIKGSNILDWLNLHQITPESLEHYLSSLTEVAASLCITWIFHEGAEKSRSYVHEGEVYFHNPVNVSNILSVRGFKLQDQTKFQFTSQGEKPIVHEAITQIYAKS